MTAPSKPPSHTRLHRYRRRLLLSALAPVLIVFYAAKIRSPPSSQDRRLAVVNFVDDADEYLWGVYSTHVQLRKFGMTPSIHHVAMISQDISPTSKALLQEWLGEDGVLEFDRSTILNQLHDTSRGRPGVFLKLQAFALTDFDKLIVLDNDVFVRQDIGHWFDYPTPAATGAKGRVEWNSGAMVIQPDLDLYEKLLEYLPNVKKWNPNQDSGVDVWDSNGGHQGYLSSFFLSNVTSHTMHTMNIGSSILSSSLDEHPENAYLYKYRPHVFQTVHFTNVKPWKQGVKPPTNPVTCGMLREWKESVQDAPIDKLPKLPNFLKHCPE